jgi:hypothetical protein
MMGRWDKFDKNRKVHDQKVPEGMEREMNRLLKDLDALPEKERREIAEKMKKVLGEALDMCNAPDHLPVDVETVVSTAVLLYSEYNKIDNPSLMIAVITKLAQDRHFNPNTFRMIANMVASMCKYRFE